MIKIEDIALVTHKSSRYYGIIVKISEVDGAEMPSYSRCLFLTGDDRGRSHWLPNSYLRVIASLRDLGDFLK